MKLAHLFAVPIAEFRLAEAESAPLNDALRKLFLAREAEGHRYRNEIRRDTQHGPLFESRFDLFTWPDAPVRELARFINTSMGGLLKRLTDYDESELQRLAIEYHAWFHITRNGGYQGLHNHQNASWSGIYCVDTGDELPDRPDSGVVRFHDARGLADMYLDAGNRRLRMPANFGAFQIKHEPGKLVVFPSYLLHEVFPYAGTRPRIVVAFNSFMRLQD